MLRPSLYIPTKSIIEDKNSAVFYFEFERNEKRSKTLYNLWVILMILWFVFYVQLVSSFIFAILYSIFFIIINLTGLTRSVLYKAMYEFCNYTPAFINMLYRYYKYTVFYFISVAQQVNLR